MTISPDAVIYGQWGAFTLSATIVFTWVVMAILVIGSWLVTRNLTSSPQMSRWQNFLEIVVRYIREQIREITRRNPDPFLGFLGTLFLFIVFSNLLAIVPGFHPPTGSLNTTAALAICVFLSVPIFGIASQGVAGYLKEYARPSLFMLPFNIIGEVSRTIALAIRLFGNIMSGTLIGGLLLAFVPLFIPVIMNLFSLLIGVIQAYIFSVLAAVYIASALRVREREEMEQER
ncbi:MAG: F0F1 ATP synthase subunit A [Candidatus Latescibacterota bacterium]